MWRVGYRLVLWLAFPFVLARLWWRGRREPRYRENPGERFGFYRAAPAMTAGCGRRNTMDNEMFETYEAPEIYELGQAEELTLGRGEWSDDYRGGFFGHAIAMPEDA